MSFKYIHGLEIHKRKEKKKVDRAELTHTVLKMPFDKKEAFKNVSIELGVPVHDILYRLIDAVVQKDEYVLELLVLKKEKKIIKKPKVVINTKPKKEKQVAMSAEMTEEELNDLYRLMEEKGL